MKSEGAVPPIVSDHSLEHPLWILRRREDTLVALSVRPQDVEVNRLVTEASGRRDEGLSSSAPLELQEK